MSNLLTIAAVLKAALLARERANARQLINAYGAAYVRLRERLDDLLVSISERRTSGQNISKTAITQNDLYGVFLTQAFQELSRFASSAETSITAQQADAVQAATNDAGLLLRAALPLGPADIIDRLSAALQTIPSSAAQKIIGTLTDGMPLSSLLDQITPVVSDAAGQSIIAGLLAGDSEGDIVAQVRSDLGVGLTRTLTISRTSVMAAYRATLLDIYGQNGPVVGEWMWVATLSETTCAMCLAMHGRMFPLDTPFGSHPNCRCVPVPVMDMDALGVDETQPPIQTGEEWFLDQPEEVEKTILGPAKFDAFQMGKISLVDIVGERDDPRWGIIRYERSLADAVACAVNVSHIPLGKRPDGSAWATNYLLEYSSKVTGAIVYHPPDWKPETKDETSIPQHLADNGIDVVLVKKIEAEKAKTPDAFVRGGHAGSEWVAWEFKSITDAKSLAGAVQDDVRKGKKQAPTILLYIAQDIAPLGGIAAINKGILSALRADQKNQAKQIVLLNTDGRMQILTREDFRDGRQFTNF